MFDSLKFPYSSKRVPIYARNGMVATSNPLASEIGVEILKKGGNAVDAAVAVAASLTVLEPTSNGIGGDAFAIVYKDGEIHGLNSSGYAPKDLTIEKLKSNGFQKIPSFGWESVTVPGAPAAWAALSEKFGELPFEDLLLPAIKYAHEGFPVSPVTANAWQRAYKSYKKVLKGEVFKNWFEVFAPNGISPNIGDIWRSQLHAKTLESIARSKSESFYSGELADKIVKFSKDTGGYIAKADLESYEPLWVKPLKVNYKGYDIWELPPNGQGMIVLMALNILKGFELKCKEDVENYHRQIESLKLAFSDGLKYITDIKDMKVSIDELLSENYAKERRKLISDEAIMPEPGDPFSGGTVYFCAADKYGNMVSYIQSNYMGFGSGIVVPETGISLQNRGVSFSLDEKEHNCLKPLKRPYHTIIPGFITKDGKAIGPFGVMGGYMQPQGHLQFLTNFIDFNFNPQAALDAPRWQWTGGKEILVEKEFSTHILQSLEDKGHQIKVSLNSSIFGRGQFIYKTGNGVLVGGTEPRADSNIACF